MSKDEQQKRDGFVLLGDVAGTVEWPGGRGLPPRPATLQARHHFSTLRQVNQLIEASEADADMGFMARLLAPLLAAAHEPKNPASVRPAQWAVHALRDGQRRGKAALR